ncbi:MAG: autoinducer binding domain-containing protein [Rhodobacteraceae bacterium]|uniref:autoinducer binding domain-containing protein n=1 Tax=Amaricoccus sp. B4 TaxID=3368557 RepID=UPI000DAD00EB|nr:autoinducer binding domain-containing protein [Paracoccaceae bacterium]
MNWFAEVLDDLIAQNERIGSDTIAELRRVRDRLSKDGGMLPRHEATAMLETRLSDAETLDQAAAIFGDIPVEFGFDEATLIILNEGGRYLSRRVISTLPDEWWTDYQTLRLFDNDPLIGGIVAREHELYLDELLPTDVTAPRPYSKAALARGIGINGVIFKIAYPSGLVAAVILNTCRTPEFARTQYRKYRDDLQALAFATCDALVYFSQVGISTMAKLEAEEIHFLRLIAISEDPAKALAMDCRYGSAKTLQMQIVRKLGVKSIFQAVLIAARRGLLDAAIFHADDVIGTRPRIAGWDVLETLRSLGDAQEEENLPEEPA